MGGLPTTARTAEPNHRLLEHFEKKVRPLLAARCWKCHGADKQEAGLRLDSAASVRRGSELGLVVVSGKPDKSRLIQAVRRTGEIKMPPEKSLTDAEIANLVAWVRGGMVWPDTTSIRSTPQPPDGSLFTDEEKSYWAFQPVRSRSTGSERTYPGDIGGQANSVATRHLWSDRFAAIASGTGRLPRR